MQSQNVTRLFAAFLLCALVTLCATSCSDKKSTGPDTACLDDNGDPLPVAQKSERSIYTPVFTNPLDGTNSLFPAKSQHSYVIWDFQMANRFLNQ